MMTTQIRTEIKVISKLLDATVYVSMYIEAFVSDCGDINSLCVYTTYDHAQRNTFLWDIEEKDNTNLLKFLETYKIDGFYYDLFTNAVEKAWEDQKKDKSNA